MKKIYLIILSIILSLSFIKPVLATSTKKLPVPFTTQAPNFNWGQPWQDACEETAIAMVDYFYSNKKFTPASAEKSILEIINAKNNFIGKSLDENAKTIIDIINGFLAWEAYLVKNPALEQLKNEIDNGRPIIVPVHGKYLRNPYFRNGGPDYHSIVISGYDDEKNEFIVEEPGTRRGLDFRYSYDTIMNAMHDFLPGLQTKFGEKIAIFTNEKKKPIGALIKAVNDSKVYLLENGLKRHIINETIFLQNGWMWIQILPVTKEFLDNLREGKQIIN